MPPETLYTTDAAATTPKACQDCGAPLDTSLASNRRYCERDRDRHRALTFLRQALRLAERIDRGFEEAVRAAIRAGGQEIAPQ